MPILKKTLYTTLALVIIGFSFKTGEWYQANQNISAESSDREILYYIDPMTPGYRSEEPGIAPCGMPLEPVYAGADDKQENQFSRLQSLPAGTVRINTDRQQLIGVNIKPVELHPMTHTLRLYGKLVTDETKTYRINASTDSWVRKLSDVTTGDIVSKNEILAEVLAPAFYNAQVTYLVTLDNVDRIMSQLGGQLRHQQADIADNQIRLAVQTLQNLGITDSQIEELATLRQAQPFLQVRSPVDGVVLERDLTLFQWFKAGEEFYTVADIGKLWVYADVYEDEVMHLSPGMDVRIKHQQLGQSFDAKVSKVLPLFDTISKTLKVRIDVDNLQYSLRPEMFVDIEIPVTLPPAIHIPIDAVIDSGDRKIVYVDKGEGVFEPRKIATGWRLNRQIEVTNGLIAGEKIVVAGNFLIDSESRMKLAFAETEQSIAKSLLPAIDPVCGMLVDKTKAANTGMSSVHEGQNFYFCMADCKQSFDQNPEKYAKKKHPPQEPHAHQLDDKSSMAVKKQSWLEMLKPFSDREDVKGAGTYPGQSQKDSAIDLGDREVIDWSGYDKDGGKIPPREWRKGWGTFPGSKYLGQKHNKNRVSVRMDNEDEDEPEEEEIPPSSHHEHGMSGEDSEPMPTHTM